LRAEGRAVGKKRIARLMRAAGIVGVSRRRGIITTRRDHDARPAPDLVDRNFTADHPNQLWVADITYVPTVAGFLYLAVVLDAFSRRIVGWAMETHLRSELVLAALKMAISQRKPSNVIHHSDQGSQGGFRRSSQHGLCLRIVSAGVFQSSVFRGRELRAAATAAISSALCMLRSVPLGKYWRSSPLYSN
jgi:putative transposase